MRNVQKRLLLTSALVVGLTLLGTNSAPAYTTLQEAIIDSTLPDVERTYTLSANESYTSALGNMGGANSTLTVDGGGYGVSSNGSGGINAVNAGQTLNLKNIGSSTFTNDDNGFVKSATITNSWSGFDTEKAIIVNGSANIEKAVFSNNGKGVLSIGANAQVSLKDAVFANNTTVSTPAIRATLVDNAGTLSVDGVTFVGNNISENTNRLVGGMIRNNGTVTQITNSDFNYNTITTGVTDNGLWGGIIVNDLNEYDTNVAEITLIKNVNFVGNTMTTTNNSPHGGVIGNYGKIGTIDTVVFQDNVMSSAHDVHGGEHGTAIDNQTSGVIDKITNSVFKNNRAYRQGSDASTVHTTGTISNFGKIGEISNTLFEGNSAEAIYKSANEGAIYNDSTGIIDKIENTRFVNNYAYSQNGQALGGAIANVNQIGDISGLFDGNYAKSDNNSVAGGAILNNKTIGNVNADFTDNYISGTNANGGAIYNSNSSQASTIEGIKGNFINNYSIATAAEATGGAISTFNNAKIPNGIIGNFIGNYAYTSGIFASGGAIFNQNNSEIGDITGNFKNNYAQTTGTTYAIGGAIYNSSSKIGNITGDFTDNYAISASSYAYGGAIGQYGSSIENITGNFENNYVKSSVDIALGGAIYNHTSTIGNITGNFTNNSVQTSGTWCQGGAIFNNNGTLGNINGNFIGNYAFTSSTSSAWTASSGAIENRHIIGNITGNFINNYAKSMYSSAWAGAIRNSGTIDSITGNFANNHATTSGTYAQGGAILNTGTVGDIHSSFNGNYAQSDTADYLALGGAVYTNKNLNFVADDEQHTFSGNYTKDYRGTKDNAIFVATTSTSSPTLKFETKNGGSFVMKDSIDGGNLASDYTTYSHDYQYNVNITGDNSGTFYMLNDMYNANVAFNNTTVNTVNNDIHVYDFNSFVVNGNSNFVPDINLANQTMDRITASSYGSHGGNLNVSDMNITADTTAEQVEVYFAQPGLKDYVTSSKTEYMSPMYKYNIRYDNRDDAGYFVFGRGSSKNYDSYNPSLFVGPVAAQLGGYLVQLNSYEEAFRNLDMKMLMTQEERKAYKLANLYASEVRPQTYSSIYLPEKDTAGWFRPYASFEKVNLKGGPTVENIMYGSYFGGDSAMKELRNGWDYQWSVYVGYNGSHQNYQGNSIYQNGGTLGATGVWYKNNFFTALTANVGASVADASTMYGSEDFPMLMTGIASKTGYNWELAKGKFIIQPNYTMSYSFINTFDYTNKAGVRINSDPLHAINITPGLKFIGNLKNGWQPYIGVQMVWNIMDRTRFQVQNVNLPSLSVKPYVQYGIGLQKRWGERFTGFAQAMIRNGGRNGIALSAGFRWAIGKDYRKSQTELKTLKEKKPQNNKQISTTQNNFQRKVIKQLAHE